MKIAQYPEFEALTQAHREVFDQLFKEYPPQISEFTFSNLFVWRNAYRFAVALKDNALILSAYVNHAQVFFCPLGDAHPGDSIGKLLRDFGTSVIRVPEEIIETFAPKDIFNITLDLNNSDYIYAMIDLVKMEGGRFDGKRNLIRKFKSTFEYEYIVLDGFNARQCLDFEERWCELKNCDSVEGLANEKLALGELLTHFSEFGLTGGAIKIRDSIVALAIAQALNPRTMVMHILKADPGLSGLYQVMLHEFLVREHGNFELLNLEQDLGVEGLRKAKLSYHPQAMIKKYTVTLNTAPFF